MDTRFTRRQVLGGSARVGLALAVGLPMLQACGDSGGSSKKVTKTIADGLKPEAGPLRDLQLRLLCQPRCRLRVRGASMASRSTSRHSPPTTKRSPSWRQVRSTPICTTARHTDTLYKLVDSGLIQPLNKTYLANIGNVVGVAARPVLRQGRRVHGSLHRVRHGHRVPRRQGRRRERRRGTRCGTPSTRASPRSSTTIARAWQWRCCARV